MGKVNQHKYKWDTEREGDKRKRIETVEERKSRRKQNKSKGVAEAREGEEEVKNRRGKREEREGEE